MVFNNNNYKVKRLVVFVVSLLLSFQIAAQQIAQSSFFELSLEELMQVDVTIATKTHVKVDDVPGMLSVISSADIQYRGFGTLWESLASLPGIQITMDSTGSRLLVVRGVGKTYASGKVKLLLNGVAMNSTINANAEALMNLPIQQIERIELIRGPGSAVHGEFSYAGVINVITKKIGQGLYTVLAQDNSTQVGGHFTWEDKHNDLNISLNISTLQSDGVNIESGLDSGNLFGEPGYSSGLVNTKRGMNSILLNVDYENIHSSLQWLAAKRGDHFGINNYLPPNERENRIENETLSFHSKLTVDVNPTLKFNASITWLNESTIKKNQFVGSSAVFGALITDPDAVANVNFAEHRIEVNANLVSTGFENHVIFTELSVAKVEVDEAEQFLNLDPFTFLPSNTFYAFTAPVSRDQERKIMSFTLQDEFAVNSNLLLTSGFRYDHYDNDIGSGTTPRIALVYHLNQEHSFRAQYAEAFRPPTFLESGGAASGAIHPETIRTFELGHQYQIDNALFKSVLFHSKLKNLITFVNVSPFGFLNTDQASLQGLEFEYAQKIDDSWKVTSNLSLLKTEDKKTGKEIYGAASVLANAQVDYKINSKVNLKTHLNYVGKREREVDDTRSILGDYLISNISISVKKLGDISGLSFHAGINNLFNEDVRYQSEIDTYEGDYPVNNSRSFWMQMDYKIQ